MMHKLYFFYLCAQCSYISVALKQKNETSLADDNGRDRKKAKNEDDRVYNATTMTVDNIHNYTKHLNLMLNNAPETCKSCVQPYISNSVEHQNSTVPNISQNDQAHAQFDDVKEKEIFNNHIQQQTNDNIQDITQKIETCKKAKKNTKNFLELTEETKKPFYISIKGKISSYNEKLKKFKSNLQDKNRYTINNLMKKEVIETLNLAEYIPECITKYAYNKEIFDKQTETIRTIFASGVLDFDEFFSTLDEEIVFDYNDKETLAKLVDMQMNNFLHKNIDSLTLLYPKMQFSMEYYNKYQDDLVFFINIKHVCMVYGMIHILETILKCTGHVVDKIKGINSDIIECSDSNRTYIHNGLNSQLSYFLVTKCEIEKMLLYILQPFLPTDHFIDLVNLFHIESVCSLGILKYKTDGIRFEKPNIIESAMLRMSTYCYIYFDSLETESNGIQKNKTRIFFRHLLNQKVATKILANRHHHLNLEDLSIRNSCFSIYICKKADKICEKFKETYNDLVALHKNTQNTMLPDMKLYNEKISLQNEIKNGDKKTPDNIVDEKKCKHKCKQNSTENSKKIVKYISFHAIVFYILNCMCNYIMACEATFIMSYDITIDKKLIEDVIDYYMKIIKNWNAMNYTQIKHLDTNIPFKRPKFKKEKKPKLKMKKVKNQEISTYKNA